MNATLEFFNNSANFQAKKLIYNIENNSLFNLADNELLMNYLALHAPKTRIIIRYY